MVRCLPTVPLVDYIKKKISLNWFEKKSYHGFICQVFELSKGTRISIQITKNDFFVNITKIVALFGKSKPVRYYLYRKEVKECSEALFKEYLPTIHTFVGRKGST